DDSAGPSADHQAGAAKRLDAGRQRHHHDPVDRLITEPGATVQFIPARDVYDTDVALTINALDASGLQELRVVGNGRDGSGYEVGDRAPAGASGRDALDCGHSLRYPAGREATSGGRGGTGQAG